MSHFISELALNQLQCLLEKCQGYHCSSVKTSLVLHWNVQVPKITQMYIKFTNLHVIQLKFLEAATLEIRKKWLYLELVVYNNELLKATAR